MSEASERVRRWRKANPEKYRAQRRRNYKTNAKLRERERERGKAYRASEAGKAKRKATREKNRTRENALSSAARKRRHAKDPRAIMLYAAKQRAKRDGLEFAIQIDDVSIPQTCPLLGVALSVNQDTAGPNSPTLDRIFNDRGYVRGNVIVVSYAANRCKGGLRARDLALIARNLELLELGATCS